MKKIIFIFLTLSLLSCEGSNSDSLRVEGNEHSIDHRVDSLLSLMSIEEKAGQMTQVNITVVAKQNDATEIPIGAHALDPKKLKDVVVNSNVGSILNALEGRKTMEGWHEIITDIQTIATTETPHKIPVLFGVDAIHGATYLFGSTLFPHNIGVAASRNPQHAYQCARVTAMETRATGVRWNFDPVFDIGRQALWPRFPETYGEDVYLCTKMGVTAVEGYEGEDISKPINVASCMKHFVGYSKPQTGWDRTPAYIPEIELREYYLPQFKAAIDAGAKTIMINSGEVNGIPTHANEFLLKKVLREELGFKGLAVSDWEDIIMLHTKHKVAETPKEAVKLAVMAGVDMSMVPMDLSFYHYLVELIHDGEIPMKRIDEAVGRILRLKFELGLFENAFPEKEALVNYKKPEYKQLALNAALESMTLLKNESEILPLKTGSKIFLTGPAANCKSALHGSWSYSWQGDEEFRYPSSTLTLKQAMEQEFGAEQVSCPAVNDYDSAANYSLQGAEDADVIVLCLGENAYAETPGSIKDLTIEERQIVLAQQAALLNKPIVVVLVEGRPRIIRKIVPQALGILMAYQPGELGATAIAHTLSGKNNPSGILPFTYPRSTGHIVLYDCKFSEMGLEHTQDGFTYEGYNPEFPFGHGLSYTSFEYSNLKLNQFELHGIGDTIQVSVNVKNTGAKSGKHAIELYTRDHFASITPSYKRLRSFQKIELEPGESEVVNFSITAKDLQMVNQSMAMVTEPGVFSVMIGKLEAEFSYHIK